MSKCNCNCAFCTCSDKHKLKSKVYKLYKNLKSILLNQYKIFPCKVGDTVFINTYCNDILIHSDNGYYINEYGSECPFEDDCPFEDCEGSNFITLKTTIVSIYNEGRGWEVSLKGLFSSYSIKDFGKIIFLSEKKSC